ncbi:MAG: D-inositol-3-phosphate glycosyltransferase [Phycisphaerae bacterium]|nr:D-inositol-3-phosphate glycosyltransferase [Phycisphaerae bacterium]
MVTGSSHPIAAEPLRVCYLASKFPQWSEMFMAYELREMQSTARVELLALERGQPECVQQLLPAELSQRVHYPDQSADLVYWSQTARIWRRHALSRHRVIPMHVLGFRTSWQMARKCATVMPILRRLRPHLLHVQFAGMAQMGHILAEEFHIPYVISVWGTDIRHQHLPLTTRALQQASGVLCQGRADQRIVIDEFGVAPERTAVVGHAVDTQRFSPTAFNGQRNLLTVARLHPVKGLDVLIEAMALLRDDPLIGRLVIVGDGPERTVLQNQIERLQLSGRVELAGVCHHEQLPVQYGRAAVVVIPSRSEGFNCVKLEALACGRPVIVTRVGGLPEAITPEVGWVVEPENPRALAAAIREALSDHGRVQQMSQAARNKIEQEFSWSQRRAGLLNFWQRNLASQPVPLSTQPSLELRP